VFDHESGEKTVEKLNEMVMESNFKGFAKTKADAESFLMEKAAFLLFLAHKKRLQDSAFVIG